MTALRYIWTIIWAFLLSFLISYVLASMAGGTVELREVFVLTAIFSIAIFILGGPALKEDNQH